MRREFQTEIPRRPLRRQFNVHVGQCQGCGRRVQGRHPLQTSDALVFAASQVGPDAQAAVVELNKRAGLSHGKVADVMGRLFGVELTPGASTQIVLRAAQRLEPAYREIREATAAAERLSVDETGWRVGGRPAWLHAWVSAGATCYQVDRRRSADALEGVIGRDWAGSWSTTATPRMAVSPRRCTSSACRMCCGGHREMLEGTTRGAVRFPRQVIELFTGAIHLRNEHLEGRVPPAVWEAALDDYELRLLPLLEGRRVGANEALAKHLRQHFAEWFLVLMYADVPPSNWAAEQASVWRW